MLCILVLRTFSITTNSKSPESSNFYVALASAEWRVFQFCYYIFCDKSSHNCYRMDSWSGFKIARLIFATFNEIFSCHPGCKVQVSNTQQREHEYIPL